MSSLFFPISKKYGLILIFFSFCSHFTSAQEVKTKSEFWSHVRFGGNLGLSFGNEFFSGTLAPSAIYQFDRQFALAPPLASFRSLTSPCLQGSRKNIFFWPRLGPKINRGRSPQNQSGQKP